ncbi:nuclear transcription factor Y subunit A-3-like [Andrographis paniculata]|uniref:nuclear transcription factor Y subunit A-3-like n=1 Tax=Andrographis paniculata TaxID=175694 RepID=UPI0021E7C21B|nr:nuclear transcription factor Y subunit A-3-like [Andrographis paniculata]XP_051131140.1 nuclear transcription factor Y subunit A-3-like [Andrographis paniculata]XP_051131141.1 nuclear transcription factor Y subunit A-3-like [Andrographis paniculata]XP_051131142.1 nuclear transcription factor Y subunit A-3-like [Andrographis paniculata]
MGKTSSVEQSASSESVHDEGYGNVNQGQDFPAAALFTNNPELSANASQHEINQPMFPSQMQFPYTYPDPFYGGMYTSYNPHSMIPQVMAASSGRVPLPVDISEDGPIYVNAKQYHGILRRRQTRAKLEAQNKLVKTRKPYLHESRHQHALNRVRGSGGRFLSTKKSQQSDILPPSISQSNTTLDPIQFDPKMNSNENHVEANKYMAPPMTEGLQISSVGVLQHQQQAEDIFSNVSSHMTSVPMQGSGGSSLVYNGNRHYASIVR